MLQTLYLTYDGQSDPLGKSQILPYLQGLALLGHEITVISFEKSEIGKRKSVSGSQKEKSEIPKIEHRNLKAKSQQLTPIQLKYHKSPPVLSTLYDLYCLRSEVKKLLKTQRYEIIHCRSYVTALVGLWAKRKYGIKFIFDMRGFWADERVEGGLWHLSNPIFSLIYGYFKKKEKEFIEEADSVISLTHNAKKEILSWYSVDARKERLKMFAEKITVIPTCADLKHFSESIEVINLSGELQQSLKIAPEEYVLLYLGSLGTWYMLDEMLDFYDILRSQRRQTRFLIVTPDEAIAKSAIQKRDYLPGEMIITVSSREEVPAYILIATASIFFIKPSFSKKASAATKMGEIMAMGKPVITNSGWGDVDEILSKPHAGVLVKSFQPGDYLRAIDSLLNLDSKPGLIRNYAVQFFSLENGIEAYHKIYQSI